MGGGVATTTRNLRYVKDGAPQPAPEIAAGPPAGKLPLGTCPMCEAVLFRSFEDVAGGDESITKSPDLRAAEKDREQISVRWQRCRHCGRAFDTGRLEPERIGGS